MRYDAKIHRHLDKCTLPSQTLPGEALDLEAWVQVFEVGIDGLPSQVCRDASEYWQTLLGSEVQTTAIGIRDADDKRHSG